MSGTTKEVLKATWKTVSVAVLKSFRGLICEKKDGGWELSLGRVSFWIVFAHCMYIWNKVGDITRDVIEPVKDAAAAAADAATASGVPEKVIEVVEVITKQADISQGELYTLFALLGYAGVKVTKEAVVAWKNGNGNGGKPVPMQGDGSK
jgi:hypothetical protein